MQAHILDKSVDIVSNDETWTDYESELQSFVSSLPLAEELKASPDVEVTRTIFKMSKEHQATHLTYHSLATVDTLPVSPIIFIEKAAGKMWAFYRLGSALCGHYKVIHGGFSATLLDEVMGVSTFHYTKKHGNVTAQLNVKYMAPVPSNTCIMVRAEPVRIEGRKIWMKGWIEDPSTERVFVEAEGLFIEPKQSISVHDFEAQN